MPHKQQRKLQRLAYCVAILSKYGFQEIVSKMTFGDKTPVEIEGKQTTGSVYVRIRMALEELGPTFIKLGQALSSREDLLPKELIHELQFLQDHVETADIDLLDLLDKQFGPEYTLNFNQIDTKPLASASIAQVYRATLIDGSPVVLKVKRPGIKKTIEADILLMRDLASVLTRHFTFAKNLSLNQLVNAFEKSLLNELSLINERENIDRFARNFKDSKTVYVPKAYAELSNDDVLVMEFIDGAKINDTDFHQKHQLNTHKIVDELLQVYLMQILEHGFFHADPHAGNVFIMADGRIAFIDMGSMATLYPADRQHLENIIINVILKNTPRLIAILKEMALEIEIQDERKLQADLTEVLSIITTTQIADIDVLVIYERFKHVLLENRVVMPDYFLLLGRGLLLVESIGRQLHPELNIMKSIEPLVFSIMRRRLTPEYLLSKAGDIGKSLYNIPYELRNVLELLNAGQLTIQTESKSQIATNLILKKGFRLIALAILVAAVLISWAIIKR
jgi:ubiquinone biosynthesis protein